MNQRINKSLEVGTVRLIGTLLFLSIYGGANLALAQTSISEEKINLPEIKEEVAKEEKKKKKDAGIKVDQSRVEKIQVVGSHIKRIDIEGPSPVQIIDREDLDRSGYNSVADVLRDTSINSFGSTKERSGSNAAGVAHVNLRGLGSTNTLVLLNGQRLPADAVSGAVDLNLIPMAAVERIEVLKDGASAIYGSDALGGVVNIVTKKDFSGTEVTLQNTSTQKAGGEKIEIGLVSGLNAGKLNMVNVVHYRKNNKIFDRDRREWTGRNLSSMGSPGSYISGGVLRPDPNCAPGNIKDEGDGDFSCGYDYSAQSTNLPDLEQLSIMSESQIAMTEGSTLTLRASAVQKQAKYTYAPAPGQLSIPAAQAGTYGLPGVDGSEDITYLYRTTELGNRESEIKSLGYNLLIGTKFEVGDTWEYDLTTSHNQINRVDRGVSGYALTEGIQAAVENGSFRPSNPIGTRGSLEHTRYIPEEKSESKNSMANLNMTGEIVELGASAISMAVGASFNKESYTDRVDERTLEGEVFFRHAGSNGEGTRESISSYLEFSVPVATWLEFQLAARHDEYSDFGSTTNPKFGFRLQPIPAFLLRGSVGTGFKAPLLTDLYASSSQGYPSFIDHAKCDAEKTAGGSTPACSPQQYFVRSEGNTGLKEETSESANLGFVIQPNKNFSMGVDGWYIKMNNVVGIDYEDMTLAEANGTNLAEHGVIMKRDPATGKIDEVLAPLQNLSAREVQGFDVNFEVKIPIGSGNLRFKEDHSQMLFFKEEGFPGAGFRDKLGDNGKPVWRNVATMAYESRVLGEVSLIGRTIGPHEQAVSEKPGHIKSYTEFDLQIVKPFLSSSSLTAGIKNVAGTTPPLDETNNASPLDSQLYDQIGRQYYVRFAQSF